MLVLGGWWFFQPTPPAGVAVGEFSAVVGRPTVSRDGRTATPGVHPRTVVHLGDRVETGDADRAEVRFHDGTTLRLGYNTIVELRAQRAGLPAADTPPGRPSDIHLIRGQVWTQVRKLTNAPPYAVRTDAATAVARGTEFGVKLHRVPSGTKPVPGMLLATLTVKEGAVEFYNAFGTVQATTMTESTARADSAPTEPKRLETLQTVQLESGATWSLLTSPLDWPEAAVKLVVGGGSVEWELRDLPGRDGRTEVRISRLPSGSPAARAGLRLGDRVLAVDRHVVTNARQVASTILFRPGAAVSLRVRRDAGEQTVAVPVNAETNALRGTALSAAAGTQLTGLLRQWLEAPVGPTPDAATEARRFEQAASLSRSNSVRAAAFNQLGVAFELDDALGSAIRAYGRAVYLDPDVPLYRFNLALALRKIGSLERALEECEAAARLEPESVPARLRVAEVTSLLARHEEALVLAEALVQAAPQDHSVWELKTRLLLKLQRPAEAIPLARRAAELDPDCPVAHAYLAEAFHAAGQLAEAGAALAEALGRAPFEPAFHVNLGTLQRDLGQTADAERSFRRALELRSDFALVHFGLGNVLAGRREYAAAAAAFAKAREVDPAAAAAHWRFGDMALKQRQFQMAERWFRQALERAPDDGESLGGLGLVASSRGNLAEAERLLRQAIDRAPDSSALHNNLGEVLRERGRLDEAEPLYRKALDLNPDNPAPYGNLGIIYAERKQFAEAEQTFRALLGRSTGNARLPALVNLAMVCGEQGKLDEAERLYRQALELAPGHPRVANGLAAFLAEHERKLDEALALATRAVQSAPDDPKFLGTLGWVQAQRGDLDAAERTLQRALDRAGQEPPVEDIRAHLGRVREKKGAQLR